MPGASRWFSGCGHRPEPRSGSDRRDPSAASIPRRGLYGGRSVAQGRGSEADCERSEQSIPPHGCAIIREFSTPGRIRTCDLPLRRRVLYPLSYWGATARQCGHSPVTVRHPTWGRCHRNASISSEAPLKERGFLGATQVKSASTASAGTVEGKSVIATTDRTGNAA